MRTIYKLKHKPTGLYYVKSGYSHISETGTVYANGCHSLCGQEHVYLKTNDQKLIKKYLDVFKSVGELKIQENYKIYNYHKSVHEYVTWYSWSMMSPVSDFEKEVIVTEEKPKSDIAQITENVKSVVENVNELKDLDSALEFIEVFTNNCDVAAKDNSRSEFERNTAQQSITVFNKIGSWLKELRDLKKQDMYTSISDLTH